MEANPDKIEAVTSLGKPANKVIPLYQLLKKSDHFVWTDEANEAFEALKQQLVNPPVLATPTEKEPMLLYIAANSKAVSVAVAVERKEEGKQYPVQRPVYFIS